MHNVKHALCLPSSLIFERIKSRRTAIAQENFMYMNDRADWLRVRAKQQNCFMHTKLTVADIHKTTEIIYTTKMQNDFQRQYHKLCLMHLSCAINYLSIKKLTQLIDTLKSHIYIVSPEEKNTALTKVVNFALVRHIIPRVSVATFSLRKAVDALLTFTVDV
jgi:hypothetical protein